MTADGHATATCTRTGANRPSALDYAVTKMADLPFAPARPRTGHVRPLACTVPRELDRNIQTGVRSGPQSTRGAQCPQPALGPVRALARIAWSGRVCAPHPVTTTRRRDLCGVQAYGSRGGLSRGLLPRGKEPFCHPPRRGQQLRRLHALMPGRGHRVRFPSIAPAKQRRETVRERAAAAGAGACRHAAPPRFRRPGSGDTRCGTPHTGPGCPASTRQPGPAAAHACPRHQGRRATR